MSVFTSEQVARLSLSTLQSFTCDILREQVPKLLLADQPVSTVVSVAVNLDMNQVENVLDRIVLNEFVRKYKKFKGCERRCTAEVLIQ